MIWIYNTNNMNEERKKENEGNLMNELMNEWILKNITKTKYKNIILDYQ